MRLWLFIRSVLLGITMSACTHEGSGGIQLAGNETGSGAINPTEEREYKRAILKCYKTGGSRVVKIEGKLMCY